MREVSERSAQEKSCDKHSYDKVVLSKSKKEFYLLVRCQAKLEIQLPTQQLTWEEVKQSEVKRSEGVEPEDEEPFEAKDEEEYLSIGEEHLATFEVNLIDEFEVLKLETEQKKWMRRRSVKEAREEQQSYFEVCDVFIGVSVGFPNIFKDNFNTIHLFLNDLQNVLCSWQLNLLSETKEIESEIESKQPRNQMKKKQLPHKRIVWIRKIW